MLRYFALSLAGLTVIALAACSPGASSQSPVGNIWILTELNGGQPLPDTTISAGFSEDGRVGGSAGCNNYNTTYTISGDKLTFGEGVATTLMACQEPVMAQEQEYLKALTATATFSIEDDTMTWFDTAGNALAVFQAQSQDLSGSSWDVISYNNGNEAVVSLIIDTTITANFGEDGQLTGNAGCNHYFASYETDGDTIKIGPAGSTEMFCAEPEGLMDQEAQYLAALQTAATYKIEANRMEMRTADGAMVANFTRSLSQ